MGNNLRCLSTALSYSSPISSAGQAEKVRTQVPSRMTIPFSRSATIWHEQLNICMLLLNLLLVTDGLPSARQATAPDMKMREEHKRSSLDSLPVTVSLQPMIHSLAERVPLVLFLVKVSLTKLFYQRDKVQVGS